MPVTKTAKRALRGSHRKGLVNTTLNTLLEKAIRMAKKSKTLESVKKASSLADRAVKSNLIHKNKASRIKSSLSKLAKPASKTSSTTKTKKTTKKASK